MLTTKSSVAAHAVANALPQTRTLTTPTGTTFIDAPVLSDSTVAVANLAAFLVDLKAAIANSATYAAFQTAVAALPNP